MIDRPRLVHTDEQLTAVIHLTVPCDEISQVMDAAISEVIAALAGQGVGPAGPCFSYHLRGPTDSFDFEVGFPVGKAITSVGRVRMSKLPAARVARTVNRGGYEGLGAAWGEFGAWVDAEGLKVEDRFWESYAVGPESGPDPERWCTELNRPLLEF